MAGAQTPAIIKSVGLTRGSPPRITAQRYIQSAAAHEQPMLPENGNKGQVPQGSALFATTSLRRNCHPRNRFFHVPSPVGRGVGVAADAWMVMDGQLLFRATETTEGGKILLLLGVLLRARIVRKKIEHSRFVDLEQVDALRPKETVVGHSKHDRARNQRID